ncbi:hypothetical protein Tco_0711886 [Tanacetum coccineum]
MEDLGTMEKMEKRTGRQHLVEDGRWRRWNMEKIEGREMMKLSFTLARNCLFSFWTRFSLVHEDNIEFKVFDLRDNVGQFCVLKVARFSVLKANWGRDQLHQTLFVFASYSKAVTTTRLTMTSMDLSYLNQYYVHSGNEGQ